MIFRFTISVLLFSVSVKYGQSAGSFTAQVQKYGPKVPGTCMIVNCTTTTDGAIYNCFQKFTKDNKVVERRFGIKRVEAGSDKYARLNETGELTGDTGIFTRDDDIMTYIQKNPEGKINHVCCGSFQNQMTPAIEKKLNEKCVADGTPILDLDNSKC